MKKFLLLVIFAFIIQSCRVLPPQSSKPTKKKDIAEQQILITTNKGEILIAIYPEKAGKPADIFLNLVKNRFYDGMSFFRVLNEDIPYIVQTGDPAIFTNSNNIGYNSGNLKTKVVKNRLNHCFGCLALASDPISNNLSTQFYILLTESDFLNGSDTVIGEVRKGIKVVKQLKKNDYIKYIKIIN